MLSGVTTPRPGPGAGWLPAVVAVLITLPRGAATYPLYLLAALLLLDVRRLRYDTLVVLLGFAVFFGLAFYLQGPGVAVTALLLEGALLLPLLLFVAPAPLRLSATQARQAVRTANVLVALYGLFQLVSLGFPVLLPYRDYLPDAYGGAFGLGGAQIVTVFGFFGLVGELVSGRPSRIFFLVALINFLLPSFVLGIVAGLVGLSLLAPRKPLLLLLAGLVVALPLAYALLRLELLNTTLVSEFGQHPKQLAFTTLLALYREQPATLLLGTGLGQFSSTPALWSSPYLTSAHAVAAVPGLFASDYHADYLGAILALGERDVYALSSSLNKPYTSLTTLLSEWGLAAGLLFLLLFFRRFYHLRARLGPYSAPIVMTVMILYFGEIWHDDPWLNWLILCASCWREPPRFAPPRPGIMTEIPARSGEDTHAQTST